MTMTDACLPFFAPDGLRLEPGGWATKKREKKNLIGVFSKKKKWIKIYFDFPWNFV